MLELQEEKKKVINERVTVEYETAILCKDFIKKIDKILQKCIIFRMARAIR